MYVNYNEVFMVQQIILSCEIFGTTNHDIEVSKVLNDELLLQLTMNLLCSTNFRFVLQFHLTCPSPISVIERSL